jgi:hypothetical protein
MDNFTARVGAAHRGHCGLPCASHPVLALSQGQVRELQRHLQVSIDAERKAQAQIHQLQLMSKSQTAILRTNLNNKIDERERLLEQALSAVPDPDIVAQLAEQLARCVRPSRPTRRSSRPSRPTRRAARQVRAPVTPNAPIIAPVASTPWRSTKQQTPLQSTGQRGGLFQSYQLSWGESPAPCACVVRGRLRESKGANTGLPEALQQVQVEVDELRRQHTELHRQVNARQALASPTGAGKAWSNGVGRSVGRSVGGGGSP